MSDRLKRAFVWLVKHFGLAHRNAKDAAAYCVQGFHRSGAFGSGLVYLALGGLHVQCELFGSGVEGYILPDTPGQIK